jgi:hypothetical protein
MGDQMDEMGDYSNIDLKETVCEDVNKFIWLSLVSNGEH